MTTKKTPVSLDQFVFPHAQGATEKHLGPAHNQQTHGGRGGAGAASEGGSGSGGGASSNPDAEHPGWRERFRSGKGDTGKVRESEPVKHMMKSGEKLPDGRTRFKGILPGNMGLDLVNIMSYAGASLTNSGGVNYFRLKSEAETLIYSYAAMWGPKGQPVTFIIAPTIKK